MLHVHYSLHYTMLLLVCYDTFVCYLYICIVVLMYLNTYATYYTCIVVCLPTYILIYTYILILKYMYHLTPRILKVTWNLMIHSMFHQLIHTHMPSGKARRNHLTQRSSLLHC